DRRRVDLLGVADLVPALVDREQAAGAEEDDRDDERPEVAAAAEPERVQVRSRAGGALATEEQQPLVRGVGDAVDRFGEQRRGSGDQESRELGRRDPHVGDEGGEDGAGALTVSATGLGAAHVVSSGRIGSGTLRPGGTRSASRIDY